MLVNAHTKGPAVPGSDRAVIGPRVRCVKNATVALSREHPPAARDGKAGSITRVA